MVAFEGGWEELAAAGSAVAGSVCSAIVVAPLFALVLEVGVVCQETSGGNTGQGFLLVVWLVLRLDNLGVAGSLLLVAALEEKGVEPDRRNGREVEIQEDESKGERCDPGTRRNGDAEQSDVIVDRDK